MIKLSSLINHICSQNKPRIKPFPLLIIISNQSHNYIKSKKINKKGKEGRRMGTSHPKNKQGNISLNTNTVTPQSNHDEIQAQIQADMFNCCGLKFKKGKKTYQNLNWEDTALLACMRFGDQVCWSESAIDVVKKKGDNRKKFMKEYNEIKYLQKEPSKAQQQIPLTANQITTFKSNLKKSVLLHPTQVVYPGAIRGSVRPQVSPYTSMIKGQNLNKSMLNSQNPYKSMIRQERERVNKGSFISPQKNSKEMANSNPNQNPPQSLLASQVPAEPQSKTHDESYISISKITNAAHNQNLRESVIGLIDDTMSSLFKGEQQQVIKMNAYQLQMFVKFTVMLERHLNDEEHKICLIIQVFYKSIYKKYQSFGKQKGKKLEEEEMEEFIQTIKYFLQFVSQIVMDYYNLAQGVENSNANKDTSLSVIQMKSFHSNMSQQTTNNLINNYENILTIVTAILFKDERFYHFVFDVVKIFNKENDERAELLFNRLHGRGPQFFSVRRQYCLNSGTLKNILQGMSIQSNIQNLVPEDLESTSQQPYTLCSQILQKIQKSRTPISKMKTILQSAQKITETISQFYQNNNTNINVKYQKMDADQVLSIFCYILTITKIQNIYSHCFLIQQFSTEFQKMSMTGYYYSVLCCAVQEDFGVQRLEKLGNGENGEKGRSQGLLVDYKQEDKENTNQEKTSHININQEGLNFNINTENSQKYIASNKQHEDEQKQNLQIKIEQKKLQQHRVKAVNQSFCMQKPGANIGSQQL